MGRVYTIYPDASKGERSGQGFRLATHAGERIACWQRVEFDGDRDCGPATVTALFRPEANNFILDIATGAAVAVTFRAWVQVVGPGRDIQPNPNVVFLEFTRPDGTKGFEAKELIPENVGT